MERVERLSRAGIVQGRFAGLMALTAMVAALLAYLVARVPVTEPTLSRAEAVRHWQAAAIAALIVLAVALVIVAATLRRRAPTLGQIVRGAGAAAQPLPGVGPRGRLPRPLSWERVPGQAVAIAALISATLLAGVAIAGQPLSAAALALFLPWLPLVTVEVIWKYERYGVFGLFALLVLLQGLHMGEHTIQVTQLLLTRGDLSSSHGAIGQLDFELVHFVTDSGVWLSLGALLLALGGRNRWLWIAFAAASLHQVEHLYLFWMNTFHESLYARGGFAGIMGEGGLIGSPLDRPYLHFAYNFIVVVPMAVALWDEARRIERQARAGGDRSALAVRSGVP
jgi:hypothetical protein